MLNGVVGISTGNKDREVKRGVHRGVDRGVARGVYCSVVRLVHSYVYW